MTAPLNPVEIEEAIRTCARRIHRGVIEVSNRERAFRRADAAYDRAFAHAYLDADGPAHEKKYRAELATIAERDARDVAEEAFKFAERQGRALVEELRSWQSVNASVRAMYSAETGVGR